MTTEQQPSDAELISAVRGGDTTAYGELFSRHVEAARRLARQLTSTGDVEDLVSEAFAKVLTIVQRGGGPDLAFRAYLLTAVRSLHVDSIRGAARLRTVDDLTPYDAGIPFRDTAVEGFEGQAAARAFASLPERWQLVLWHTEVEGQKPADVAKLLGMSANSVSALAYRAREGLRQAFLNMHAQDTEDDVCAWTQDNLGAYIRNAASKRDSAKVRAHIDECRRCMGIYLELSEVNSNLSAILGPLVLGSAAAGYIAAAVGGAAQGGLLGLLGRTGDIVAHHSSSVALAGVAATIVLITGLFLGLRSQPEPAPVADPRVVPNPSAPLTSVGGGPTLNREPSTIERLPRPPQSSAPDIDQGTPSASPTSSASIPGTPPATSGDADEPDEQRNEPPSSTINTPQGPPPTTHEPMPEVDAAVSAVSTEKADTVSMISVSITGVGEEGGVLEITSSNNADLNMGGECPGSEPARRCRLGPGATQFNFMVNTGQLEDRTMIFFHVSPLGEAVDPNGSNNDDYVELKPAP